MRIRKKKELGISILEALMATVIVGVGFVAVFQMVNYSVNSIDISGERTKANYLVSMLAEDVIGHRNSLYGINAEDNTAYEKVDAPRNKYRKWNLIFETDRHLKCRSAKDIKTLKVFKLCRWSHCDYIKDTIFAQALYIGRIQININDGKKRKFLYFQADYKLKD